MEAWKIRLEKTRCTRAGCPLPAAREYYALLTLPQCARRDLCAPCFDELLAQSPEPPIYWKARRQPGDKKAVTLDVESLRALFWRLAEERAEGAAGLRYLVALLLLRKRAFKVARGEGSANLDADLVVVDPRQPEAKPVALYAPELDDAALAALKDELVAALGEAEA